MARSLALLFICLGVVAGRELSQAQICDKNGAPLQPKNSLLTSNRYDADKKTSVINLTWRNPLVSNPKGGCISSYRVEVTDAKGTKIYAQGVPGDSLQDPVKTQFNLAPGNKVTMKVFSVSNNKLSPPETVGTVTTAQAPDGTQKPVPL